MAEPLARPPSGVWSEFFAVIEVLSVLWPGVAAGRYLSSPSRYPELSPGPAAPAMVWAWAEEEYRLDRKSLLNWSIGSIVMAIGVLWLLMAFLKMG